MDSEDRRRLKIMISVIDDLTQRGGMRLRPEEKNYLRHEQAHAIEEAGGWRVDKIEVSESRLKEASDALARGFVDAAAEGIEYAKEDPLATNYSSRVESNYPEGNSEFIRFSKTYWSIKGLVDTIHPSNRYLAQGLLSQIESGIGNVFFPYPGHGVNPGIREERQRELLRDFAPKLDIDKFIEGNAILIRDRQGRSGGCLSVFVIWLILVIRLAGTH